MKLVTLALVLLAAVLLAEPQSRKAPREPEIELVEVVCQRREGLITLDGKVRNRSMKPVKDLTVSFRFFAPGKQLIGTESGPAEPEVLEPGEDGEFHFQTSALARAVEFDVGCVDGGKRELRLDRTGPFPID